MKKIYFVRHGESEGNVGPTKRGYDSSLTKEGLRQAEVIAKRISAIDFDVLFSSTYKRALQTAQQISKVTGKEILTNDLLFERERPSEQIGQNKHSEEFKKLEEQYDTAFFQGEKYKDGESFKEITDRAQQVLNFLDEQEAENMVVVTHGMFLRVLCALVLLKKHITPETCFEIMKTCKTKNTGITMIQKDQEGPWRLTVWNDHAHFGEY